MGKSRRNSDKHSLASTLSIFDFVEGSQALVPAGVQLTVEDRNFYRAELKYQLHREMRDTFERLKREEGLTYKVLAERLDVHPSVITLRFKGRENLTLDALSDTFRAMGTRLECKAVRLADLQPNKDAAGNIGTLTLCWTEDEHPELGEMLAFRVEPSLNAGRDEWEHAQSVFDKSRLALGQDAMYEDISDDDSVELDIDSDQLLQALGHLYVVSEV